MYTPFDGDTFIGDKVRGLCLVHGVRVVVETGTAGGASTRFFSSVAERVVTIEKDKEMYDAHKELDELENVTRILGDSGEELPKLLQTLKLDEPVLFYLDGHGYFTSPVVEELRALASLGSNARAIVVIHDFKVLGEDLGFNTSDTLGEDRALSYENLKGVIADVFRLFNIEYNSEKTATGAKRGVAYIVGIIR